MDLTPAERSLLSGLRTGGHTPQLAWYHRVCITSNQDQPEPATCQRCGLADETLAHVMTECPTLQDARTSHFDKDDPSLFSLKYPQWRWTTWRMLALLSARRKQ